MKNNNMRLTEKNEFGNYIGTNLLDDECLCRSLNFDEINEMTDVFNKLGQLEDIEEELGIDLVILFKALKYGVYYFTNGTQLTRDYVWLISNYVSGGFHEKLSYSFITAFEKQSLLFNDYGKTWAITKEELENESRFWKRIKME